MSILSNLLKVYRTKAEIGRLFGVTRGTATPWFKAKRIPEPHWEEVTRLLPGVSIEQCHREFGRKPRRRRPKTKTKSNIN